MKTIGLIGGMSWESSLEYYRKINQEISQRLGGLHSAKIIMESLDFHEIEEFQRSGQWHNAGRILADSAKRLEKAGADFILICTNTMHRVAPQVQTCINIPLVHIADAMGEKITQSGHNTLLLLGTCFTMEHDFLKGRLNEKFNLDIIIPGNKQRRLINDIIFKELCLGRINPDSKKIFLQIIESMKHRAVSAVILGCTEIGLLVKDGDVSLEVFDSTALHCMKAVELACHGLKP